MAEATSHADCVERHREYPIDVRQDRIWGFHAARVAMIVERVPPATKVLDVGCNSGYLPEFLPGREIHGVDVAPGLVEIAKTRLASARVAEAEALPFPDKSFDVVVLGEIIEHVYDAGAVLREAARVARTLVVGSTPHEGGTWGAHRVKGHAHHVRCYTLATLMTELGDAIPGGRHEARLYPSSRAPQIYCFEAWL